MGPNPGVVIFRDGDRMECEHVDPHDGYVFARHENDEIGGYIPWDLIKVVQRTRSD